MLLDLSAQNYHAMNYNLSIEKSKLARNEIVELNYYIDHPEEIPHTTKTSAISGLLVFIPLIAITLTFKLKRRR